MHNVHDVSNVRVDPTTFVLKVLWIFLASWPYFQQPSSYSSRYNNLKLHRWRSRVTNQILLLLRCSIPNLTWIARELANHLPDCAWDQSCRINSFRRARTFHTYLIGQRKNKGQRTKDRGQHTKDKDKWHQSCWLYSFSRHSDTTLPQKP